MTILKPEQDRSNLKLDTFNKGFVWSALQLRQQTKSTTELNAKYGDWIQVSHELVKLSNGINQPRLNLSVKLPLNSANFLLHGGLIGNSIDSFASTAAIDVNQVYKTSIVPNMTKLPVWVITLEQYCYWCALQHAALLIDNNRKEMNVTINEQQNPNGYILITATFPLLLDPLFNNLSYVDSINLSFPDPIAPSNSNALLLNNASLIGN